MKLTYIINNFAMGGAETGLLHLIDSGFFKDFELDIIGLFKGNNMLEDELKKRSIKHRVLVECIDMKYHLMPIAYLRLKKILKSQKPEIIIMSLAQANILGRIAARSLPQSFKITFEHNVGYAKNIYNKLLKLTSNNIDAVFYDSEGTKNANQHLHPKIAPDKWFYVPLIKISSDVPQKISYKFHQPVEILSVGRLNSQKNYYTSINVIADLSEEYNVRLNIIGNGEQEEELKNYAKKLGITDKIIFHGFVRNWQEMAVNMDLFLQSSTREGLCISVIEAMAVGLPVISTNVGGMRDYGVDHGNMLKSSKIDAKAIAKTIEIALSDNQKCQSIGKQAREDAFKMFGEENVQQQLKKVNDQIIKLVS